MSYAEAFIDNRPAAAKREATVSQTSPGRRSPQGLGVSVPDCRERQPTFPRRRQEVCACADRPAETFFLFHRARRSFFLMFQTGVPAAPRAVGRGGARERAQFSPQAETEPSGLCDDDNGGRIPLDKPPCGSRIAVAAAAAARLGRCGGLLLVYLRLQHPDVGDVPVLLSVVQAAARPTGQARRGPRMKFWSARQSPASPRFCRPQNACPPLPRRRPVWAAVVGYFSYTSGFSTPM